MRLSLLAFERVLRAAQRSRRATPVCATNAAGPDLTLPPMTSDIGAPAPCRRASTECLFMPEILAHLTHREIALNRGFEALLTEGGRHRTGILAEQLRPNGAVVPLRPN